MIETLFLILGFVVGQGLGRVIFYRRGYKAGNKAVCIPPDIYAPIPMVKTADKYSIALRTHVGRTPEDRIRVNTWATEKVCEDIAYKLLANRVIRPVILEDRDGIMEIGASIYAVSNPAFNRYLALVFFDRDPMQ